MHAHVLCPDCKCLLVGAINPFTFKEIIDMCDPFTTFLIILGSFSVGLFLLIFSAWRGSFCICCKADLVVLDSLNFLLSGKILISPSNLKESLAGRVFLVVGSSLSSL